MPGFLLLKFCCLTKEEQRIHASIYSEYQLNELLRIHCVASMRFFKKCRDLKLKNYGGLVVLDESINVRAVYARCKQNLIEIRKEKKIQSLYDLPCLDLVLSAELHVGVLHLYAVEQPSLLSWRSSSSLQSTNSAEKRESMFQHDCRTFSATSFTNAYPMASLHIKDIIGAQMRDKLEHIAFVGSFLVVVVYQAEEFGIYVLW